MLEFLHVLDRHAQQKFANNRLKLLEDKNRVDLSKFDDVNLSPHCYIQGQRYPHKIHKIGPPTRWPKINLVAMCIVWYPFQLTARFPGRGGQFWAIDSHKNGSKSVQFGKMVTCEEFPSLLPVIFVIAGHSQSDWLKTFVTFYDILDGVNPLRADTCPRFHTTNIPLDNRFWRTILTRMYGSGKLSQTSSCPNHTTGEKILSQTRSVQHMGWWLTWIKQPRECCMIPLPNSVLKMDVDVTSCSWLMVAWLSPQPSRCFNTLLRIDKKFT